MFDPEAEFQEYPEDCHRHCLHYEGGGCCCDCGEEAQQPVSASEFFKQFEVMSDD